MDVCGSIARSDGRGRKVPGDTRWPAMSGDGGDGSGATGSNPVQGAKRLPTSNDNPLVFTRGLSFSYLGLAKRLDLLTCGMAMRPGSLCKGLVCGELRRPVNASQRSVTGREVVRRGCLVLAQIGPVGFAGLGGAGAMVGRRHHQEGQVVAGEAGASVGDPGPSSVCRKARRPSAVRAGGWAPWCSGGWRRAGACRRRGTRCCRNAACSG